MFVKSRAYVEKTGQPWFILSAKHGLVHPETVICPYELTLKAKSIDERREWARRVFRQLEPHLNGVRCAVFLAGKSYRKYLKLELRARGIDVVVPMKGLLLGEQLRWLTEMARCRPREGESPEGGP